MPMQGQLSRGPVSAVGPRPTRNGTYQERRASLKRVQESDRAHGARHFLSVPGGRQAAVRWGVACSGSSNMERHATAHTNRGIETAWEESAGQERELNRMGSSVVVGRSADSLRTTAGLSI